MKRPTWWFVVITNVAVFMALISVLLVLSHG